MNFFSRLFRSTAKKELTVEAIEYKAYLIYPDSKPEGGQFRIAGRITKQIDADLKVHHFIRSDLISSKNDADKLMLQKARLLIDQMGESIFD